MSSPDAALASLLDALAKRDTFAWSIAHPDGLAPHWAACRDARVLLRLYARTGDRRGLVRAACACAREALVRVPAGESRPLAAIECAERWARGEASAGEVAAARIAQMQSRRGGSVSDAGNAAFYVTYEVTDPGSGYAYALAHAERAAGRSLADVVRAAVECPELAALVARP